MYAVSALGKIGAKFIARDFLRPRFDDGCLFRAEFLGFGLWKATANRKSHAMLLELTVGNGCLVRKLDDFVDQ